MSGQSIVDRLNAAKHTVAGSALGRAVVKATTEEIMGPKRKHLEYLLACTSEINVSIPQMADLLIERTQNTSWVVTYKSLITIHHLMCYGNERFSQYMASHNSKFILNNFMDKTGVQGIDMSSYIRKYAHYLNEKRETYKLMGFDFCKVKRGKDDGMLRTMSAEKLVKALPILQKQLDALVNFDIAANELTNGVINSCFCLLSKDLIRLFACYNDGIINLLEKFFDMSKKMCKEALDIYKKFLERTDSVSTFLKVAESSGIDKSEIPDLAKAPSSLLDALEAHVNGPDAKKSSTSVSASNITQNNKSSVNTAINSLNNNNSMLSAEEQRRVLEEEAKTLESFKAANSFNPFAEQTHLTKQTSLTSPTNENPFGTNGTNGANGAARPHSNQDDLFGLDLNNGNTNSYPQHPPQGNPVPQQQTSSTASDDLLMLSGANPFIQNMVNNQQYQTSAPNPFQGNGMMAPQNTAPQMNPQMNLFQSQQPMMNNNQNKLDDIFGDLSFPATSAAITPMQPFPGNLFGSDESSEGVNKENDSNLKSTCNDSNINKSNSNLNATANTNTTTSTGANYNISDFSEFDAFGDVLQPTNNLIMQPTMQSTQQQAPPAQINKPTNINGTNNGTMNILSTDLESSLASLADNLDINRKNNNNFQKNHQWNGATHQQSQVKTGGQNWNMPTMTGAAPNLNSPLGNNNWGSNSPVNATNNNNAFNPFATAIQPTNQMVPPVQQPAQPASNNPFDLF